MICTYSWLAPYVECLSYQALAHKSIMSSSLINPHEAEPFNQVIEADSDFK